MLLNSGCCDRSVKLNSSDPNFHIPTPPWSPKFCENRPSWSWLFSLPDAFFKEWSFNNGLTKSVGVWWPQSPVWLIGGFFFRSGMKWMVTQWCRVGYSGFEMVLMPPLSWNGSDIIKTLTPLLAASKNCN